MSIDLQSKQRKRYIELLQIVGSLSKLFSDNSIPYLYYRVAENIFCEAFSADNLSRSDCSADARLGTVGYGLKTFLYKNGKPLEKIAEFNKQRGLYSHLDSNPEKLIYTISDLRNLRIESTNQIHGLSTMKYHCVARSNYNFVIHEEPIEYIQTKSIHNTKKKGNIISFQDGIHEYSFNISKSTLLKRFIISPALSFPVKIVKNPIELLEKIFDEHNIVFITDHDLNFDEIIYLPLYSTRGEKHVSTKSGLNQRNAGGRKRDDDEVYISIPSRIHTKFHNFFPDRDTIFNLNLPNKEILHAKVCQQNEKALMSNPNKSLGKWLLRDVLKKNYGEIVTYNDLLKIGIDTVEIGKKGHDYYINFKNTGTFEKFQKQHM